MTRVLAYKIGRELSDDEIQSVGGGTISCTDSVVKSGIPLEVESTDPCGDPGDPGETNHILDPS